MSNTHLGNILIYSILVSWTVKLCLTSKSNINYEFKHMTPICAVTQLEETPHICTHNRKYEVITTSPVTAQGC